MRSGSTELNSGRWHWTILPQWTGATVVYQHRDRVHDEMRSWTQAAELSDEEARELALDPLERIWMDADGLKWRVTLELPTDWRGGGAGSGGGRMWLVFRRGAVRKLTDVPDTARLGELTHADLKRLLDRAHRGDGVEEEP